MVHTGTVFLHCSYLQLLRQCSGNTNSYYLCAVGLCVWKLHWFQPGQVGGTSTQLRSRALGIVGAWARPQEAEDSGYVVALSREQCETALRGYARPIPLVWARVWAACEHAPTSGSKSAHTVPKALLRSQKGCALVCMYL